MVCFDTDFLIACLQKDPAAIKKLEELQASENNEVPAVTTMINAAELWKGVYRSKEPRKEAAKVEQLLSSLELITLDYDSAMTVGELDAIIRTKSVAGSDLLISSVALVNKHLLVTRNKKDFRRVPNLQIETW